MVVERSNGDGGWGLKCRVLAVLAKNGKKGGVGGGGGGSKTRKKGRF